ncbi:MAG: hypothetical protein ACKVWV_10495 [Planctomycetota bacterium]
MNQSNASTPFFAKYLVDLDYPQVQTDVKAGEGQEAPPPIPHLTWPLSADGFESES